MGTVRVSYVLLGSGAGRGYTLARATHVAAAIGLYMAT